MRFHKSLLGVAGVFLLTWLCGLACESDQLIWMVRSPTADSLYRFVVNGKAGYIDRTGKVAIPPVLRAFGNSGYEFHDGLLEIGSSDGVYIDSSGQRAIEKVFERGWDFSEGLAAALPKDGDQWGYIDRSGGFAISPRFAKYPDGSVDSFSDGLAKIRVSGRVGYIDRTGEFAIPPRFLHGERFHDGMAQVVVDGPCVFRGRGVCGGVWIIPRDERKKGENTPVTPGIEQEKWEDTPPCRYSFVDRHGALIAEEGFEEAGDFSEGLAAVRVEGRWGYIDKTGSLAIRPQFEAVGPFSNGLARVGVKDLDGYIDRQGHFAIPPQFQYGQDFAEGVAVVGDIEGEEPVYWYIDRSGRQAIPDKYALASPFRGGLAHVKLGTLSPFAPRTLLRRLISTLRDENLDDSPEDGVYAYIDASGRRVFTYESIQP